MSLPGRTGPRVTQTVTRGFWMTLRNHKNQVRKWLSPIRNSRINSLQSPIHAPTASAPHRRFAQQMIERRRLRAQFFDSQFFGEHGWELLLSLFAREDGVTTIARAAQSLQTSTSTVMVMARLLAAHGLVHQGDSDGDWGEIPLQLSDNGFARVRKYLEHLQNDQLVA
jgi:hypothetical protein